MLRFLAIQLLALFVVLGSVDAASAQSKKKDKEQEETEATADEAGAEGEEEGAEATTAESATSNIKRGRRMEFDARLIRGERASGAVFLFQRETRPLPSMVKRRTSYLDDTVRSTLGDASAEEFRAKQSDARKARLAAEEERTKRARKKSGDEERESEGRQDQESEKNPTKEEKKSGK